MRNATAFSGRTCRTVFTSTCLLAGLFALGCQDLTFDETEITVEVSSAGYGSGTVTGPSAIRLSCLSTGVGLVCHSTFIDAGAGGAFTLDARPDSISRFVGWSGACSGLTCTLSFSPGQDTTFRVRAHFKLIAPTVTIESPLDGAAFAANQTIEFRSTGMDARGRPLIDDFAWTSSLDGPLCLQPPPLSCRIFSRTLPTRGQHSITVTMLDRDSTAASASIRVTVLDSINNPPRVEITTPADGFSSPGDQPVRFSGFARDPEDGVLPDSILEWSSSRDGRLGFGYNLSRLLSTGAHRITLAATDSQGATGRASVDINVTETCASQPRAWYRLDGDGGDASGNANYGTVQGATPTANRHGEAGQALEFDGSDDSVELGDVFNTLTLPFTIAAWVYRPATAGGALRALFVSDDEPGRYAGIWLQTDELGQPSITFADGAGSGAAFRRTLTGTSPIPSDAWVHVTATVRAATDMTLYVNGAAVTGVYSGTGGPLAHSAAPARIGRITILPTNRPWLGRLDELRIYNCSLNAAEVAALHALR